MNFLGGALFAKELFCELILYLQEFNVMDFVAGFSDSSLCVMIGFFLLKLTLLSCTLLYLNMKIYATVKEIKGAEYVISK